MRSLGTSVALAFLAGAPSAPAVMVYVDAIDGIYHSGAATPNTFNAATDSATDWTVNADGTPQWRFRNSGPGAVSYGTSCYMGRYYEGDGPIYTKVTGLTPGRSYAGVRLYFAVSASDNNWIIQCSLDGGANWSPSISRDSAGVVRLMPSTTDALGTATNLTSGDTRCYVPIAGSLTADANGEFRLYVRSPSEVLSPKRTVYDGFAYDDGSVLPLAGNPRPRDGGRLFGTNSVTALSWTNPPATGTITCNVYFGNQAVYNPANPGHFGLPLIQSSVAAQSVPMPPLSVGGTYYWIVDCVDSVAGLWPGALWSFEVVPASAASGVVISEFMAANHGTLTNSLGQTADWIELYNNSAATVNLTGWHLTDSAANLRKWTFPAVSLAPDSYLLVWADEENRVVNGEIHTSFKLSADGEFLALVRPDGVTIEHQYAPVFPEQADDLSYGVDLLSNGADVVLLPSQAGCRIRVPAGDIGTAWRNRIFNDNAWTNAATGVGFEISGNSYDEYVNTDVEAAMYNQMASVYLRIPFRVDDPAAYASLRLNMLFEDGFVAWLNGVEVARSNAPAALAWNAAATASRSQGDALVFTTFAITNAPASLLVSGTNILAVHGLNHGVASPSLLVQPQLEATAEAGVTVEAKRYYAQPSPGANNIDSFLGLVADTKFSVDRGFFTAPFAVSLSCATPGADIRYTLDGTTPTEVAGTLYTGPVPVNTTTILRAVAFKPGWKSSDVDTQTYLFVEDIVHQPALPSGWPATWAGTVTTDPAYYSDYEMDPDVVNNPLYSAAVRSALTNIPTLSVVTDQAHLFDPATGIYSNPREEGVLWERPASAEWILPDGTNHFQVNCGLQIQGAGSRGPNSTPKHSLRLVFKSQYGPSKLDYALFPDTDVESFNTVHLRAIYNLSWLHSNIGQQPLAQENQDQFARDVQLAMGQETVRGNVCHLYLNGLYWGLYHPGERPDAAWAAAHFGGAREDWDVLNHGEVTDGNRSAWDSMWSLANSGLGTLANYDNFRQYCDVTALADYMIINHYVGNRDWDNVNWYAVRRRMPGAGYKFICWDTENSLVSLSDQKITGAQNNPGGPTTLFARAVESPEFQLLLADRIHRHLFNNGPLTPSGATNLWRRRSAVIDRVIAAESARWGDFRGTLYTPNNQYLAEQNSLFNTYFPARTANVLAQYAAQGLYPAIAAPEFGLHGGRFTNSTAVALSGPGTIYYTLDGTDPRQCGTGAIAGTQYTGAITLNYSTRVKARCLSNTNWSALLEADFFDLAPSHLRVSEVMRAPRPPAGSELAAGSNALAFAFVEIQNTGTETAGLVGVSFQGGVRLDFSRGPVLSLAPGQFLVVAENPAAFAARYPSVPANKVAGEYRGDLVPDDSLKLLVEGLGEVVSFECGDGRGWPLAAEGAGHSLVPLALDDQSSGRLSYGGNWKASVNVDGSPAAAEPGPLSAVALNEICAHTDFSDPDGYPEYDSNDWIELVNRGGATASLNGYYLSDDPSDLKKWAIPAGTNVAPGRLIAFDEITGFHSPIPNGFGIDKAGEQILLSFAAGSGPASVVDAIRFKGQENGRTLGRYPDGAGDWFVCLPTRGAANARGAQQPVISEIMYHPPEITPGVDNLADEFVEIFNPTAQGVNLWSLDGGTNLGPWRLAGQVEYAFPASTALAALSRVLLVSFDPATNLTARAAFLARYGLSGSVALFGPFDGNLSNRGGRLALEKPQAGDLPGEPNAWVIVDEVFYFDELPWMPSADGAGESLQRTAAGGAGANPNSWTSGPPTPGSATAGAAPLLGISPVSGRLKLEFVLPAGSSYAIELSTNLLPGSWTPCATVAHPATDYTLDPPAGSAAAYYRLRREP